jgi:CheY-like chemotaxis protein
MDINMPVIDGLKATKIIKNLMLDKLIPDLLIICVSAYDSKNDKIKITESGADGYLSKPF